MIGGRYTTGRSGGFALILVLWFLVLIAAISTYLMANARSETAMARNIRAAAAAEALADAAVAEAVFNQSASPSARWKLNGEPHLMVLPSGEATLRLYDETQKINPNHASAALLAGLFEAAGVERGLTMRLGAAIADWVGPETEPRPLGAERQQYTDAGRSYGPPNTPIESIDELQLVLGMTPDILARVRPYLTIHTDSGQPEGNDAPPIVRRALALAARGVTMGEGDDENSEDAGVAPTAPAAAAAPATSASIAAAANVSDEEIVRLEITARASTGGVFVRHAVLKLDADSPKGYVVLDWRRGNLID